jgi:hypothetical protein
MSLRDRLAALEHRRSPMEWEGRGAGACRSRRAAGLTRENSDYRYGNRISENRIYGKMKNGAPRQRG